MLVGENPFTRICNATKRYRDIPMRLWKREPSQSRTVKRVEIHSGGFGIVNLVNHEQFWGVAQRQSGSFANYRSRFQNSPFSTNF